MGPHAPTRPGRHGHLVLEPAAESLTPGSRRATPGQHLYDLAHLARGRSELAEEPHLVRNRRGDAHAQARRGARQRSRCDGQKKLIEQAYTLGAQLGLLNRAGFLGGILAWITRLGQAPPSERSSALRLQ